MNATIDIKTPSGQSLEGFPATYEIDGENEVNHILLELFCKQEMSFNPTVHKGDRIIIEIGK